MNRLEVKELQKSEALNAQYREERAEGLTRINRLGAWAAVLLICYLAFLSDPASFPQFYHQMLPGRLIAIVAGVIIGILSFVPALKRFGVVLSFFVFLAGALMMAHLTAVMDNQTTDIIAWILVNIIFCGIYPLPLGLSGVVVLIADAYYIFMYLHSGHSVDLDFRQALVNINSASFITLAFKIGMERIRKREFFSRIALQRANQEIADLNNQLQDENLRLSHELEVAQHIQSIVLPRYEDYSGFEGLDISCEMIPAAEVGGDYYDTINLESGGIIAVGDVTDHGLHSGLIMMMVHTALRALSSIERNDTRKIMEVINKLLYDFRIKTKDHRIMSLIILKYLGEGKFAVTGQHESLLIIRKEGNVEDVSSLPYGMFAGLEESISSYLEVHQICLAREDILVLYTDGITEAVDAKGQFFGREGIIDAVSPRRSGDAESVRVAIIEACREHIGTAKIYDDLSVVVIKKK